MWVAVVFAGLFAVADWAGWNTLGPVQASVNVGFVLLVSGMLAALRHRPGWYGQVALALVVLSHVLFVSALMSVPNDELRMVWFFLAIGGTYILLGQVAGAVSTLVSLAALLASTRMGASAYSGNAVVTGSLALCVCSVLFHIYTRQSQDLYLRLQEANAHLLTLARNDPLTGLLNGRAFHDAADGHVNLCQRDGAAFSVLFLDLDHFKRINDHYGHDMGDTVLREAARQLAEATRESDLLGRIGGEEFAVLLPRTRLEGALGLAEKIRQTIAAMPLQLGDVPVSITVSVGVAEVMAGEGGTQDALKWADQAMYQAKAEGRNRVAVYRRPPSLAATSTSSPSVAE